MATKKQLMSDIADLENVNESLRTKIGVMDAKFRILAEDKDNLAIKLSKVTKENHEMRETIDHLQAQNHDLIIKINSILHILDPEVSISGKVVSYKEILE